VLHPKPPLTTPQSSEARGRRGASRGGGAPVVGGGLRLLVLHLQLLLAGHHLCGGLAHFDEVLLHFVHRLVQHLLRVLRRVDRRVHVRLTHARDPAEDVRLHHLKTRSPTHRV
jgi:hypothetical protein